MAKATLSAPLTLDPRQALTLRIRSTKVDHVERAVMVTVDYLDNLGAVVSTVNRKLTGAAVDTWIGNQETTLLTRFLAAQGLTGTVAP